MSIENRIKYRDIIDRFFDLAAEGAYLPCPCGCGKKMKFVVQDGNVEAHIEAFVNKNKENKEEEK